MNQPKLRNKTAETALFWAKTGADILFSESDPFDGKVSREVLEKNLYDEILRKLVDHDTTELTEEEFKKCVELSKLN